MKRAIILAKNGLQNYNIFPTIGFVIVKSNIILFEGWNYKKKYLDYIFDQKNILRNTTIYITLEPFSKEYANNVSYIKLILNNKIDKIVIGIENPFDKGLSINILKKNKINVISNILKKECYFINLKFFTFHKKKDLTLF